MDRIEAKLEEMKRLLRIMIKEESGREYEEILAEMEEVKSDSESMVVEPEGGMKESTVVLEEEAMIELDSGIEKLQEINSVEEEQMKERETETRYLSVSESPGLLLHNLSEESQICAVDIVLQDNFSIESGYDVVGDNKLHQVFHARQLFEEMLSLKCDQTRYDSSAIEEFPFEPGLLSQVISVSDQVTRYSNRRKLCLEPSATTVRIEQKICGVLMEMRNNTLSILDTNVKLIQDMLAGCRFNYGSANRKVISGPSKLGIAELILRKHKWKYRQFFFHLQTVAMYYERPPDSIDGHEKGLCNIINLTAAFLMSRIERKYLKNIVITSAYLNDLHTSALMLYHTATEAKANITTEEGVLISIYTIAVLMNMQDQYLVFLLNIQAIALFLVDVMHCQGTKKMEALNFLLRQNHVWPWYTQSDIYYSSGVLLMQGVDVDHAQCSLQSVDVVNILVHGERSDLLYAVAASNTNMVRSGCLRHSQQLFDVMFNSSTGYRGETKIYHLPSMFRVKQKFYDQLHFMTVGLTSRVFSAVPLGQKILVTSSWICFDPRIKFVTLRSVHFTWETSPLTSKGQSNIMLKQVPNINLSRKQAQTEKEEVCNCDVNFAHSKVFGVRNFEAVFNVKLSYRDNKKILALTTSDSAVKKLANRHAYTVLDSILELFIQWGSVLWYTYSIQQISNSLEGVMLPLTGTSGIKFDPGGKAGYFMNSGDLGYKEEEIWMVWDVSLFSDCFFYKQNGDRLQTEGESIASVIQIFLMESATKGFSSSPMCAFTSGQVWHFLDTYILIGEDIMDIKVTVTAKFMSDERREDLANVMDPTGSEECFELNSVAATHHNEDDAFDDHLERRIVWVSSGNNKGVISGKAISSDVSSKLKPQAPWLYSYQRCLLYGECHMFLWKCSTVMGIQIYEMNADSKIVMGWQTSNIVLTRVYILLQRGYKSQFYCGNSGFQVSTATIESLLGILHVFILHMALDHSITYSVHCGYTRLSGAVHYIAYDATLFDPHVLCTTEARGVVVSNSGSLLFRCMENQTALNMNLGATTIDLSFTMVGCPSMCGMVYLGSHIVAFCMGYCSGFILEDKDV